MKDRIDDVDRTGIYELTCGDYGMKYYGQTRRTLSKRYKEHLDCIKLNQPRKSAFAKHALYNDNFNFSVNNIRLLKQVKDQNTYMSKQVRRI